MRKLPYREKNGLNKGPWTEDEDLKLIQYVQTHGPGKWRTLPKNAGLQRCGKSCRLRWTNYLRPDIKRGRFSFEEEEIIIQLHTALGNKWSAIAARLPGRTDNEIKNYWNTHIRKRLLQNGIDPVTHTPRLDFLQLSSMLNSARSNLSNLLNIQSLVNPQLLILAALIASSTTKENQPLFLNNVHINTMNPNPNPNPNQHNPILNPVSTQILNQRHLTQANDIQYFAENMANPKENTNEDALLHTCLTDDCFTNPSSGNQLSAPASENSSFLTSYADDNVPSTQSFNYDSVLSSPISSPTQIISPSRFINNSSAEEDPETYCSDMFKLEIPENFELNDII